MVPQANSNAIQTERENAIINGIMSGDNACGALNRAFQEGRGPDFLREKIAPTLGVYEEEAADLRKQRDDARRDVEAKRFALEFIASNLGGTVQITEPAIVEAIRKALPGREI